MRLQVRN